MASPASGPLRLARALALTAVVFGLAAGAHVAGGAELPAPTVLALLAAVILAGCVVATRSRLGLVAVGCLLGIGQVALHHAFGLLATSPACAPVAAPAADAGHAHHGGHEAVSAGCGTSSDAVAAPLDGLASGLTHGQLVDRTMLFAHVAATLAAALVLLLGERALWWLAAWLRPALERLTAVARLPQGVLPGVPRDHVLVAGPQLQPGPAGVRGPPGGQSSGPPGPRT
ncbi:hypothetical protein QUV83_13855 [Cellulomonas cellasea]|uniref:hypothetical protein n=1 Tax=Cellulomonas cellasea TaxID=43670 RepID=UPI0025A409AB|nr:hypothetical protein [Cellulomonas cellasea]MDM8085856.1 hypothetical protein [Cellulomonas cellasea]